MFILTECPSHGTVEVPDLGTFATLLPVVRECVIGQQADSLYGTGEHAHRHAVDYDSCWSCCPDMLVDPYDILGGLVDM